MAKSRTDKSPYPSRYSPGGWVAPHQYILELVCENEARKDKKDLPFQFWKQEQWKKRYTMQLRRCHKLLKSYDAKAIIAVLKKGKIYSLFAPWMEDEIKKEQVKLNRAKEARESVEQKEKVPEMEYKEREVKSEDNARSQIFNL